MALDSLTAAQGDACAPVGAECCVYIPDYHANISYTLTEMHIKAIDELAHDPFSSWLASLTPSRHLKFLSVTVFLLGLVLFFLFLYCCCGVWLPFTSLSHKSPGAMTTKGWDVGT